MQKYCDRPKKLSKLIKAVIVFLAITEILRSIFPSESPPFPVKWMVLLTLLKYIINIFDTRESDLIYRNSKMGEPIKDLSKVQFNNIRLEPTLWLLSINSCSLSLSWHREGSGASTSCIIFHTVSVEVTYSNMQHNV